MLLFKHILSCVQQNFGGHQGHQRATSTFSLGSSIPQASFGTRALFSCTALKCSQILPHYARTRTKKKTLCAHTVPVPSFQSASVLPLLSYEVHTADLHKDQREEFLRAAKSMPVIILPATQSHKSIKNMAVHLIILKFKNPKRQIKKNPKKRKC